MDSRLLNYAKSPIPVLNNLTPYNYVIMPALLSNVDAYSSSSFSSSSSNSPLSSPSFQLGSSKILLNNKINSSSIVNHDKSSKEIIYTTKRIQLKNNNDNAVSPNYLNGFHHQTEVQSFVNESSVSDLVTTTNVSQTSLSSEENLSINSNSTRYITDSFVNDNTSLCNNNQAIAKNINNNLDEIEIIDHSSSIETYTIACPSDWHFNVRKMLNCVVFLDKLDLKDSSNLISHKIKLTCSACKLNFENLDDLADHKEENTCCKNNFNIINSKISNNLTVEIIGDDEDEADYIEENNDDQLAISDNESDIEDNLEEEESRFDFTNDESIEVLPKNISLKSNKKTKRKRRRDSDNEKNGIDNENLEKPRRKYTKVKPVSDVTYNCEKCNKLCRTKAELLVHTHKHSGKGPECWQCGKKCASFSNLVSHVQLHTGEKPYSCQFCGKQFTQDAHLTRHIRLHTGERPFVCNICGKNYKDYSYYKTHLRIHRGERLYKCQYCNKEYYDASYYKKHTRLHTGEKPYMCTVCGRQFHRSDYLKLHSFSHTDERPFSCHICGKGFKMKYNLKTHLKTHENCTNTNYNADQPNEQDMNEIIITNNDETEFTYSDDKTSTSKNSSLNINQSSLINLNLNDPKLSSIVNTSTNGIVTYYIQDVGDLDLR